MPYSTVQYVVLNVEGTRNCLKHEHSPSKVSQNMVAPVPAPELERWTGWGRGGGGGGGDG